MNMHYEHSNLILDAHVKDYNNYFRVSQSMKNMFIEFANVCYSTIFANSIR